MSVAATPFDDRGALLERLGKEDKSFSWERVFSVAARETDEEVEVAAQAGEVSRTSAVTQVSRGKAIIKNGIIGMSLVASGLFFKLVVSGIVGQAGGSQGGQGAKALESLINGAASFFIAIGAGGSILMFMVGAFYIMWAPQLASSSEGRAVMAFEHMSEGILEHAPISS